MQFSLQLWRRGELPPQRGDDVNAAYGILLKHVLNVVYSMDTKATSAPLLPGFEKLCVERQGGAHRLSSPAA